MVPSVWIVVAFLLGAATGGLTVAMQRISTLSRIREEFKAELDALIESSAKAAAEKLFSPQDGSPRHAA